MSEPWLCFDSRRLGVCEPRGGGETYRVLRTGHSRERNPNHREQVDSSRETSRESKNFHRSEPPFHCGGGAPGSHGSRAPDFIAADRDGSARFSPNLLKAKKRDRTGPPARKNFYRWPACGEMVNNTDRESVGLHHDHVLHPPFYRFAPLPMLLTPKIPASDSAGVNRPFSDRRVRERSESQRARI